ncbi:hypothetical protein OIE62_07595 [Streptomyces scopuliridis]|uniref:Uncharacterized protein n=1 Tax=Streptomyces scopuliridis TaxID=452529 RepID=A0ACD4ZUD7_9ACTN|nr:hypothetical protein [Streptomyces scopuliridis]WSC01569.1 hypothetical protein OG835_34225 [Streptomyces scopuliridis]WSC04892.1 hypothetical protein OIE62_07595 [Streptomyces scopuliridis]
MTARPHGVALLHDFDATSQLHYLAERIHHAANEMPPTNATQSSTDNLDELDERAREIAALFIHIATAAAHADREANDSPGHKAEVTQRRVTALTHVVGTLGRALAELGEAVAHAGGLHQVARLPRSPDRVKTQRSMRSALDDRLDSARRHLNEAGRQLHTDADRLTARRTPRSPQAPSAEPGAPRPAAPTTASTRAHRPPP